jgi:predicted aspartyl protease
MPMLSGRSRWVLVLVYLGSISLLDRRGASAEPDNSLRAATQRNEIRFKLYNEHAIVVRGDIGSLKNVPLMLDTGKSPTAISKEIANRLNLHGNRQSLLFSNGTVEVQSVTLPSLRMGDLHMADVRVVVQDFDYFRKSTGISLAGIVGLDVLSTGNFMIDYRKRKIVFGRVEIGRKTVQFETRVPFLTVKAQIDGQVVRLLVDSGTSGLLVYSKRLNKRPEATSTERDSLISTAVGPMLTTWSGATEVLLGKENLGPQSILISEVEPDARYDFDGLLGFFKIGFRKVSFDFINGSFSWE